MAVVYEGEGKQDQACLWIDNALRQWPGNAAYQRQRTHLACT